MPRVKAPAADAPHLWVKQGKTEHMATLDDPGVLSKLRERREKKSSSFSISELSILDLVPSGTTEVTVCWASTNQNETVEASTIRFRDLASEGRGGRRRRNINDNNTASKNASKKNPPNRKRKRKVETTSNQGIEEAKASSTNTSIVSTEGQDDINDENSLHSSGIEPMVQSLPSEKPTADKAKPTDVLPKKTEKESSGEEDRSTSNIRQNSNDGQDDLSNKKQNNLPQKKNLITLGDEDFDSSDDEAIIYRMKLKRERVKTEQDKDIVVEGNTTAVAKLTSKRSSSSTGLYNSDSDYGDSSSSSHLNRASIEPPAQKKQKLFPNGYDSDNDGDEENDDGSSPAKEGQTNVKNWMKMKQIIFKHRNYV